MSLLFWCAALAIVVGQVMILRSTARAWHGASTRPPFVEQIFAWGPALVLIAVLWFSWKAATRPPSMEVEFPPAAQGVPL